jgi:hypothetical protein
MAGGGGGGNAVFGSAVGGGGGRYGQGMLGAWPPPGARRIPPDGPFGTGVRELDMEPAHGAYLGDAELQDPSDDIPGGNDPDAQ